MGMTPLKNKRPLPSSTSIIIPDPLEPQTTQEWRIALQRVKTSYFKGQWKQCASRCNELLDQDHTWLYPLNITYLNYYAALSGEAIARSMHNLSTSKISLLDQAKAHYQAAITNLPAAINQDELHSENFLSPRSSGTTTPTPSRPTSPTLLSFPSSTDSPKDIFTINPDPEPSTPTPKPNANRISNLSLFSTTSPTSITRSQKRALQPLPLNIQRPPPPAPMTPIRKTNPRPVEPSTPLAQILPPDISALPTTGPRSVTFSASSYVWLQGRSLERHNAHLSSFAEMLENHIDDVEGVLRSTREAQGKWERGRRGLGMRSEGMRERILRLKLSGWERRVFDGERVRDVCERALGEL